ncbi:MAG: formyltetrahydrofolate deformylase [Acidimicrobiaceae bacterium]|jgi:formyltetrahydrofolate deformylase|nr:formyltetrahydrofolate deformylase [Acidimicrobiaceae bacterium]MDQ1367434.1 formyltetrahydrofolate deformylase [Acidimicrobiaceae bacterium]MDQ1415859.1 formyltetrahydrofolate deformylase [Acidimicrobiaceae bacterium]MDQ1421890.1 formyltetrahydrofolate deformylase [Acidimicrobiaceae bacterium]MDQ1440932.1 formyltetrahydrofolate deformylase [Acidimicrobiaceae bacterium]
MSSHILTLVCPDRPGIVASIAEGLLGVGANIVENAQFSDMPTGMFCMRTRFESPIDDAAEIVEVLRGRAEALHAELRVRREDQRCRTLIMVSKYDHCLVDLLYRWRAGELQVDIPVVVSNHPDLAETVTRAGIGFEHVPVTDRTRAGAEDRVRQLVAAHDIELVVLARYMQIVSNDLCRELAGRMINIHHSFLPSFKGAKPYHQAWERGVKVIGATAHYVTPDLDEGPIIDQDVARVAHSHTPDQMVIVGRDLERLVLSRAVKAHSEGRVFLLGRRTVVFL